MKNMSFGLFIAIFLGLIFGSFGSVILSRWGESKNLKEASSILRGRSQCPYCKTTLQAWDLVPLFSFLFQKGRCRYCKKKISWLYPILELGSAILFGLVWFYFSEQGLGITVFWSLTTWILWLMIVYDVLRYEVHIPLLFAGSIVLFFGLNTGLFAWESLWGSIVLFFSFLFFYWFAKERVALRYKVKEEGMGFGDVLISPYLGALLFAGLPAEFGSLDKILAVLYFFIFSGIIGILWYVVQNKYYGKKAKFLKTKMADHSLPFLPAMIFAVSVILIFQDTLFGINLF